MNRSDLQAEQQQVDQRRQVLGQQLGDQAFVRSLPPEQDALLRRELEVLNQYSQILTERQQNFFDPQPGQVQGIAIPEDQELVDRRQPGQPLDENALQAQQSPAKANTAPVRSRQAQDQPVAQQKAQQQQKQAPVKKAVQKQSPQLAPKKMVGKSKK